MKKQLTICLLTLGVFLGASNMSYAEGTKVCQGHGMIDVIDGRLETAKRVKQRWDEEISYDRSIKEHKSEMYRENGEWVIEYSWKHVDNCPDCNKSIIADLSEPTPQN